jgi:Flp pilus assembly protein TadG
MLKGSRDGGAVAIEAALIFPVLILILFGIVEFSLALRDHVSLSAAVRSGARVGSAEPRLATFASDAAAAVTRAGTGMPLGTLKELWIYEAGTNGYPTGQSAFSTCSTKCIKYTYNKTTKVFVSAGGSWAATAINACPGDVNMTSLGIYVKALHTFASGLFGAGMTLTDHAVMRFEPIPASSLTGVGDCK